MKVGIITLLDEKNYGNRWQNYAMNELLHSVNIETENIYFWKRTTNRSCWRETIKRVLPIKIAYYFHAVSAYQIKDLASLRRVIKFTIFTKKYMGAKILLGNNISDVSKQIDINKYDYFVAGSDQIWNPYYVADPFYFLQFAPPEKRIAFMASFGSDEIPEDIKYNYAIWIGEMQYVSVREPSGASIIESLIGEKIDVFLDPTLLVKKSLWLGLSRKQPNIKLPNRYAVAFMFDCEIQSLKDICYENNLELLILNNKDYKTLYSLDPAEMLYVLNNAQIIFTDSFHIMALSIKLNKQFYVFKRTGFEYMFSRLESTLKRLDLMHCEFVDNENINLNPIPDYTFEKINFKLEEERLRFLAIIKKALQ